LRYLFFLEKNGKNLGREKALKRGGFVVPKFSIALLLEDLLNIPFK